MALYRATLGGLFAAACLWGTVVWCVPLTPEMPPPGASGPLASPVLSPENPLDRELFGETPGQTKTVPPPDKTQPEGPAGRSPSEALPAKPSKPGGPTPPDLLPDSAEPRKPAASPAAPLPQDYSRVSEAENPLVDIARRMREAERLLAQAQSGQKTQELQDGIVKDLDELLKRVAAQCQGAQACQVQCSSPQVAQRRPGNAPVQGPAQPTDELPKQRSEKKLDPVSQTSERPTLGRDAKVSPEQRKTLVRGAWGSLPERHRQQMMQLLPPEEFLPKYESMIEEYYRRLGEENGHGRP